MSEKKKMIFITSLERSGSTFLDLTLGAHPSMVSFGEVARVLEPHCGGGVATLWDRECSCGAKVGECEFWRPVLNKISVDEGNLSLDQKYSIFLEVFYDMFGPDKIPVDSSKFYDAMDSVFRQRSAEIDVKFLFTVRDVRGWCSSSRKADKRKREMPYSRIFTKEILRWWKPYLRHNVLRIFPFWLPFEWYWRNLKIDRHLQKIGANVFRMSYEGLALKNQETLARLYAFLGEADQFKSSTTSSHIIRGNRMAFDAKKTSEIIYDTTWMKSLMLQYEVMAWPMIMKKNVEWVYPEQL